MNKLSVLVPLYNHEKFIVECVNSILNSDYPLEVIVADDNSTDNSYGVVSDFLDLTESVAATLIRREENGGTPAALNTCLEKVSPESKYLAVVASDDFVSPDHFLNLIDHLEEYNLDSVYSNYVYINEKSEITKVIFPPLYDYEDLTNKCNIPFTTAVHKRELFDGQLWDEKCVSSEDWDMMLRVYKDSRVGRHPSDRGYHYRVRNLDDTGHIGKCYKHTKDGTLREVHNYIRSKIGKGECECGYCTPD